MYVPDMDLGERGYELAHIEEVLAEIRRNFPKYFASFHKSRKTLKRAFEDAIDRFEREQQRYEEFLDLENLEEYEYDPNAFKRALKTDCPIIRRCINSEAEAMKKYKAAFNRKSGQELLEVVTNIRLFGLEHVEAFDEAAHERCETVDELGRGELLEEDYVSYSVIGGGIRSLFLFSLYPSVFTYRSQNALWALYFLTDKKDFGFEDASEFLMIDVDKSITQQNYHYPYDLFSFYALKLFLMLKEACESRGYHLHSRYRYVYLDTFFNHVAEVHEEDINLLKGPSDDERSYAY